MCIQRIQKARANLELFEQEQKLAAVWKGYVWIAERLGDVSIIDGDRREEAVFGVVKKIVEQHPKMKG